MCLMALTCWQALPPSANTSMKTSWGHGKFVPMKRRPWTVLIAVKRVTIVAICSLFPLAKKLIESEITFLSGFKSEGCVYTTSLHHSGLRPCLYSLKCWLSFATSAPEPPNQYEPSNHLPHLIITLSVPLWKPSKCTVPKGDHADKTSAVCSAEPLDNRGW